MNECFMMGVFDGLKQKLPPFQEYSTYIHEKKATALVAANNTKTIQFSDLRKAVFFEFSGGPRETRGRGEGRNGSGDFQFPGRGGEVRQGHGHDLRDG